MKVLVVGATGAVGRQLVPQLAAAGHAVVAGSNTRRAVLPADVDHRQVDVLDLGQVSALVRETRPEVIVHQATALSGLGNNLRRFDQFFEQTNLLRTVGTANLIDAAATAGYPRLIVQSFTGWVLAQTGGPVKSEPDPLDDRPPKHFRKTLAALRALEAQVAAYPDGVVLRYGGLYGPGTSLGPGGAQTEAARRGRLPVVGAGTGIWSFVHVGDAASAVLAALTRGGGIYNIVDDDPAPVHEWLPELARAVGGPPPKRVPVGLARLIAGDGLVRMMTTVRGSSNAKARVELQWRPRYRSWREGFATVLNPATVLKSTAAAPRGRADVGGRT